MSRQGAADAGRVPDAEVLEVADAALERGLDLAPVEGVQARRLQRRPLRLGEQIIDVDVAGHTACPQVLACAAR